VRAKAWLALPLKTVRARSTLASGTTLDHFFVVIVTVVSSASSTGLERRVDSPRELARVTSSPMVLRKCAGSVGAARVGLETSSVKRPGMGSLASSHSEITRLAL